MLVAWKPGLRERRPGNWINAAVGQLNDFERPASVELKREVPLRGCYELKHLPAATLACAYSGLDDDAAERAYAAIRNWTQVRGYSSVSWIAFLYMSRCQTAAPASR
jgi:hypothetical protein